MEKIENERPELAEQFNAGHQEYSSFIETDPIRQFLHYPNVIKELGEVSGQHILDIGCGDGLFDRKLAKEFGAKIVGYDISPNLVEKAKQKERETSLGIEYQISDPTAFNIGRRFDNAVSVTVMPYASDEAYLKNFFAFAYNHLKEKGKFVSVVFNPDFSKFNEILMNRFFRKGDGVKVEFDFLAPQSKAVQFSAELAQFSKEAYETGARGGGFGKIKWQKLMPTDEGVEKLGADFWQKANDEQPYALIIAKK